MFLLRSNEILRCGATSVAFMSHLIKMEYENWFCVFFLPYMHKSLFPVRYKCGRFNFLCMLIFSFETRKSVAFNFYFNINTFSIRKVIITRIKKIYREYCTAENQIFRAFVYTEICVAISREKQKLRV